jgi:pyruvyltransferase
MSSVIRKCWRIVKKEMSALPEVIKCKHCSKNPQEYLIVKASVKYDAAGNLRHDNWGDDMNLFFLQMITGKKVMTLPETSIAAALRIKNYVCIGSTLTFFDMRDSVVWGSGILDNTIGLKFVSKPAQIMAVRGPLSRKWVMEQGVDCPEVYGDPILLLPDYYKPQVKKTDAIGVIPHFSVLNDPVFQNLKKNDKVRFIPTREYDSWQGFVDAIAECSVIISSSLHGLIVAYAYGVPAVWVKDKNMTKGWDTKFYDFYYSVNLRDVKPLVLDESTTLDELLENVIDYSGSYFDKDKLISVCPFDLL